MGLINSVVVAGKIESRHGNANYLEELAIVVWRGRAMGAREGFLAVGGKKVDDMHREMGENYD